jgi:hypothetical protein
MKETTIYIVFGTPVSMEWNYRQYHGAFASKDAARKHAEHLYGVAGTCWVEDRLYDEDGFAADYEIATETVR